MGYRYAKPRVDNWLFYWKSIIMLLLREGGHSDMSKLDFIMEMAESEVERRAENEMAHTDHTNYSDSYCIGID